MFGVKHNVARGLGFGIGVAVFAGTHAIEVAMWPAWFGGAHDPWFLNSGRAIAFTLICFFGVSLLAGVGRVPGLAIAAGGAIAMTFVLALGGGSTLFPIVVTAGALAIGGASLLGAWLGAELGRLLLPKR
jgi:hypothetical protein